LETYINFNGKIIGSGQPVIQADNRGFQYGDGLFETIRIKEGQINLSDFHFQRLFYGAQLLQFELPSSFTAEELSLQILELCRINDHLFSGRVRLVVFRTNGSFQGPGLDHPDYIIQSSSLSPSTPQLNKRGLQIDIFPEGRKAIDQFSNLKTNNYLLSIMGSKYAKAHQWDDCVILNSEDRICETTVTNIFCVKNERIYTPGLSEGCVSGVVRRFLLEKLSGSQFPIQEQPMDFQFVKDSEEVFLTNAIHGLRWVESFGGRRFGNKMTTELNQAFINKSL
jgi:branched-chain amino acid aminotransferase